MTDFLKFDQSLFHVQRLSGGTDWVTVPSASVTYTSDYSLNDNSTATTNPSPVPTLIIGSETATISITRYGNSLPTDILYPADRVQVKYDGKIILYGDVETISITDERDPEADRRGYKHRYDVVASVGGYYAHLLSRTVTWTSLPTESWPARLARFGVHII